MNPPDISTWPGSLLSESIMHSSRSQTAGVDPCIPPSASAAEFICCEPFKLLKRLQRRWRGDGLQLHRNCAFICKLVCAVEEFRRSLAERRMICTSFRAGSLGVEGRVPFGLSWARVVREVAVEPAIPCLGPFGTLVNFLCYSDFLVNSMNPQRERVLSRSAFSCAPARGCSTKN